MAQNYHCIAIWHEKWRREEEKGKRKREEQRKIREKAMTFVTPKGTVPGEESEAEEETGAWKCG